MQTVCTQKGTTKCHSDAGNSIFHLQSQGDIQMSGFVREGTPKCYGWSQLSIQYVLHSSDDFLQFRGIQSQRHTHPYHLVWTSFFIAIWLNHHLLLAKSPFSDPDHIWWGIYLYMYIYGIICVRVIMICLHGWLNHQRFNIPQSSPGQTTQSSPGLAWRQAHYSATWWRVPRERKSRSKHSCWTKSKWGFPYMGGTPKSSILMGFSLNL